jgi:hypothetical protein
LPIQDEKKLDDDGNIVVIASYLLLMPQFAGHVMSTSE